MAILLFRLVQWIALVFAPQLVQVFGVINPSVFEKDEEFSQPPTDDYLPRGRNHPCFKKFSSEPIIFITSFPGIWIEGMLEKAKRDGVPPEHAFNGTIMATTLGYPLVVYHEEALPSLPLAGVCTVDLMKEMSWIPVELNSPSSGLNRYYNISGYHDPASAINLKDQRRNGGTKQGTLLMLKVASIYHAVESASNGSVVFWVDTDVIVRERMPASVTSWLQSRDVIYIPFFLGWQVTMLNHALPNNLDILKSHYRWRVESGLFALTANDRSRKFMQKALSLYRGGMYVLAKRCFLQDPLCFKENRVKYHVFLNDIFVFAILLHADLHNDDRIFSIGLKHGVFAMQNYESPEGWVWGATIYKPLFPPVAEEDTSNIVTNFNIQKYVFHYFGFHRKGALAMQMSKSSVHRNSSIDNSWRTIASRHQYDELREFLGIPHAK